MSATSHPHSPALPDTSLRTLHPTIPLFATALSLCALTFAVSCSRRQSPLPTTPAVSCSLSTNSALIGDPVQVSLQATHPSSVSVRFPPPQTDENLEISGARREEHTLHSDWTQTRITYTVQPFHTGTFSIFRDTSVHFSSPHTNYSLRFTCPPLHVVSLIPGTNLPPLRPLKGPYLPRMSLFVSHFKALLVLGLVMLPILSAALILLRRRRMPEAAPAVAEKAPHEITLEALRQLQQSQLMNAPDAEPFYVRLSQIIRDYIEPRFGIRAPELTTEEFVREAAQSVSLSGSHRLLLEDFLKEADLVKFACFRPDPSARQRAMNAAIRFVQDTTPEPQVFNVEAR